MDTRTLPPSGETSPSSAPPHEAAASRSHGPGRSGGLAAELRESLMLLSFAVGATVGLTAAAQAALALLG